MLHERLNRLQAELQAAKVDCVIMVPGANLTYMTGLHFHLMERATALFIPAEGTPAMVLPSLEKTKLDAPDLYEITPFTFDDGTGPENAFSDAARSLPEIQRVAVEYLAMRVMELKHVQRVLPTAFLIDAVHVMNRLRLYKDAAEIAAMQQAVRISEAALIDVIAKVQPGMTEQEAAAALLIGQFNHGGETMPFAPLVLSGPKSALPHGTSGDRPVREGEPLLFDFGTTHNGYVSDITRTFFVGEPSSKARDVYETVKAANEAGRAAAGPGVPAQEVDRAARRVIEQAGFGEYFVHRTGHGVGLEGHEAPYIVEGNEQKLEAGMAFTIEPGIYIPGEVGVRIEDDVVVTEDGILSLSTFPRDLKVIGS